MWPRWLGGSKSREAPARERRPSADDFTPQAVRRALLLQTLQHPAVVLPFSVAIVAAMWSAVIDFGSAPILTMLAGGFVYNFMVRGDRLAERHVKKLRERRTEVDHQDAIAIVEQCARAGFTEGEKEARDLQGAYDKLRAFLDKRASDPGNLAAERFRILAEDSHQDGVSILRRALTIFEALREIDVDVLVKERNAWAKQRERAAESDHAALDRRIESNDKRIALYRERERILPILLAEVNEIETALDNAFLAVVDLVGDEERTTFESGRASTELEAAVQAARRVEEKLRNLSQQESGQEKEYLEAARRNSR
jgi:hypothetical protein